MRLAVALFIVLVTPAFAQPAWQRISDYDNLHTLTVLSDGVLLAGATEDGLRSTDGGASFDTLRFVRHAGTGYSGSNGVTPRRDRIEGFAELLSPGAPAMYFAAGFDGAYRSEDGMTWEPGPPGITPDGCALFASRPRFFSVGVSPQGRVLFTGLDDDTSPDCKSRGHSFLSEDGGTIWDYRSHAPGVLMATSEGFVGGGLGGVVLVDSAVENVLHLVDLSPGNATSIGRVLDGSMYIGMSRLTRTNPRHHSSGVWQINPSDWTGIQVNAGLPSLDVTALAVTPDGTVVAGTYDAGLTYLDAAGRAPGGRGWQPMNVGLDDATDADGDGIPDDLSVLSLAVALDGQVLAATRGGLFATISRVVANETDNQSARLALKAWPNPAAASAVLEVAVPQPGDLEVAVFDAVGRRVAVLHDGPASMGTLRLEVDTSALPPGVYVMRASSRSAVTSRRLVVAR